MKDAPCTRGLIACDLRMTGRMTGRYAARGTGRSADFEPGAAASFERASGDGDGKLSQPVP